MIRRAGGLGCICLMGWLCAPPVHAQFYGPSVNASTMGSPDSVGSQNYMQARNAGQGEAPGIPATYNLKVGELYIRTSAGLGFSYNDNISLRNEDLESDFIVSPNARFGFYLPFTRENALRFSIDMGAQLYLNHDEYTHFTLFPNGDNSFELYAQTENWAFRLRDGFSLHMSPLVNNSSTGSTDLLQFVNVTSLTGDADYDTLVTGFVYNHGLYKFWGNDYEYLDRQNDALSAHVGVRVSSPVIVGVDFGVDHNYYDAGDLNSSVGFNTSAYSQFILTRAISGRASVGWGWSIYDDGGDRFNDNENFSDIIFGLALTHEINKYMRHSINVSKNVQPGITSNFQDTLGLTYNVGWDLFRFWTVDVLYSYIHYNSSNSDISETASIHSIRLGHSWQLTKSINVSANYNFNLKDSDLDADERDFDYPNQNYQQNVLSVSLQYAF